MNREKWQAAQIAERNAHGGAFEHGLEVYADSYKQYFEHFDMTFNQEGKTIMEIGPADFPALTYCHGYKHGHVIEPMPSSILDGLIKDKPITLHKTPAEDMPVITVDEVWLFNVYQHVIDAHRLFEYAKECGRVVRFFEPIDLPTDICHLHSFSLNDFKKHFGGCVKLYKSKLGVKNFHGADCAYGTWINPKKI